MYDSKIVSGGATDADFARRLDLIHNLLTTLSSLAPQTPNVAASQETDRWAFPPLSDRYAQANGIARRRASALLNEAGVEGGTGLQFVTKRGIGRTGDAAAAAFLHGRLDRTMRRIDRLLSSAA